MPRTIRFHLDENCPRAVAASLRRRGIDVTATPEAGLLEGNDEQQDAFAFAEGRVIFTQDEDFLVCGTLPGRPTPESPTARKIRAAFGEIIRGLVLIWEVYDQEEMQNRVEYL